MLTYMTITIIAMLFLVPLILKLDYDYRKELDDLEKRIDPRSYID